MATVNQRKNQLVGAAATYAGESPESVALYTVTVTQAAALFGVSRSYAYRVLRRLVLSGDLKKECNFWKDGTADEYALRGAALETARAIAYLDRAGSYQERVKNGL